jgi:hypothetical protein
MEIVVRRPSMHSACYIALMLSYLVAAIAYGLLTFAAASKGGVGVETTDASIAAPPCGDCRADTEAGKAEGGIREG